HVCVYPRDERDHSAPRSFPTRRSSDLDGFTSRRTAESPKQRMPMSGSPPSAAMRTTDPSSTMTARTVATCSAVKGEAVETREWRSEEHTSELQSRFDLVCRLLLEKKKD